MNAIKTKTGLLKDELQKNKVGLIAYLVKNNIIDIKFSIRDEGYDTQNIIFSRRELYCPILNYELDFKWFDPTV